MGILKDHISIISFLKPGIVTIHSKSGEDKFYVEDGILEFKNNNLSLLTSNILNLKTLEKSKIYELIKEAENDSNKTEITDQLKFLSDQKNQFDLRIAKNNKDKKRVLEKYNDALKSYKEDLENKNQIIIRKK